MPDAGNPGCRCDTLPRRGMPVGCYRCDHSQAWAIIAYPDQDQTPLPILTPSRRQAPSNASSPTSCTRDHARSNQQRDADAPQSQRDDATGATRIRSYTPPSSGTAIASIPAIQPSQAYTPSHASSSAHRLNHASDRGQPAQDPPSRPSSTGLAQVGVNLSHRESTTTSQGSDTSGSALDPDHATSAAAQIAAYVHDPHWHWSVFDRHMSNAAIASISTNHLASSDEHHQSFDYPQDLDFSDTTEEDDEN